MIRSVLPLLRVPRNLMLLAAAGSASILIGAFIFQSLGYAPCKLCLWQRWPHAIAIVLGLIALAMPWTLVAWTGALTAIISTGLGIYHSGVERGWWEGPTSCTASGGGLGGLSGADLLSVDSAERLVLCDEIPWSLFGLSMANYNVLASIVFAGLWIAAAIRARD